MKKRIARLFSEKPDDGALPEEIAAIIRQFVSGDLKNPYAWDDLMSIPLSDPYGRFVQRLVEFIEFYFPAYHEREWCSNAGGKALLRLAEALESKSLPFPPTEEELQEMESGTVSVRYSGIFDTDVSCDESSHHCDH